MRTYILLFCALLMACGSMANNPELESINNNLDFNTEKIYLLCDRETYTRYDDIWFSIFLVDAQTNIRELGLRNVYVELIGPADTIVLRNLILSVHGMGYGDFKLNKDMPVGKYYIRAYTNYQKNFGDQFIFKKAILINEIYDTHQKHEHAIDSMLNLSSQAAVEPEVNIQFFPECGQLVNGVNDKLAFIATDQFGRGYDFEGAYFNASGDFLDSVHTLKNGLGEFFLFPEDNESYYLKINGSDKKYELPENRGKLHFAYLGSTESGLRLRLIDYTDTLKSQPLYLVNFTGGQVNAFVKLNFDTKYKQFNFPLIHCKNGINQFTITDQNFRPLIERLIFVQKEIKPQVVSALNFDTVSPRQKTVLKLKHPLANRLSVASLSVSYSDLDVKTEPFSQTIESYFLAQSELKGKIENPSYYFNNIDTTSQYKLDLLMRTHGWRKYAWNDYKSRKPDLTHEKDYGIDVKGHARKFIINRHIIGGKATLMFLETPFRMFDAATDSLGQFQFNDLFFTDTSKVVVLVKNKRNKNNTEIDNLETFRASAQLKKGYASIHPNLSKLKEFNKLSYTHMMEDRIYNPDKYHILLDEITVIKEKPVQEDDGHDRIYGSADVSIDIDEEPVQFQDVLSYLYTVPGVTFTGSGFEIRGGASFVNNEPKYLIDGIDVDYETFITTPIDQVDKIEVLKSPINLAVFGMTGANGVLAIYTKRGEIFYDNDKITKGLIGTKIRGYYESRVFYSPVYTEQSDPRPDNRITVYWNPNVIINSDSLTAIEFFNADKDGDINIHIEGLTNDGMPYVFETKYTVKL